MKSFTDLEQSKKLSEILPLESADMWFANGIVVARDSVDEPDDIKSVFPSWSLTALLSVIPQEIFDGEYIINITEGLDNKWCITYDNIDNRSHSLFGLSSSADNPIDACYEMIIKLHKRNVL